MRWLTSLNTGEPLHAPQRSPAPYGTVRPCAPASWSPSTPPRSPTTRSTTTTWPAASGSAAAWCRASTSTPTCAGGRWPPGARLAGAGHDAGPLPLPTYDGETVTVTFDEARRRAVAVTNGAGVEVAAGSAACPGPPAQGRPCRARRQTPRPTRGRRDPATSWAPRPRRRSPAGVSRGADPRHRARQLGRDLRRRRARPYLADVREELPLYAEQGIAHPGWVLRLANRILSGNVVLGPWIHVGSAVRHHGPVHDGAKVSCRGTVAEEYERKGHRFVRLDLGVVPTSSSSPPSTTPPSTCPARSPPPADCAGRVRSCRRAAAVGGDAVGRVSGRRRRGRRRPASRPPRRAAVPPGGSGSPPSPR